MRDLDFAALIAEHNALVHTLDSLDGDLDDISDGATYAKVKTSELISGEVKDSAIDHDQTTNFDSGKHFTEASIDHTAIQNIGSNTHGQLDSHLADNSQAHSDYIINTGNDSTSGILTMAGAVIGDEALTDEGTGILQFQPTTGTDTDAYYYVRAKKSSADVSAYIRLYAWDQSETRWDIAEISQQAGGSMRIDIGADNLTKVVDFCPFGNADLWINHFSFDVGGTNDDRGLYICEGNDEERCAKLAYDTGDFRINTTYGDIVLSPDPASGEVRIDNYIKLLERSSDPTEPGEGSCIIWMSDGTAKGDDGDVLVASKAGGATKWTTLLDHSAGTGW